LSTFETDGLFGLGKQTKRHDSRFCAARAAAGEWGYEAYTALAINLRVIDFDDLPIMKHGSVQFSLTFYAVLITEMRSGNRRNPW
jgi:hypothetical protein